MMRRFMIDGWSFIFSSNLTPHLPFSERTAGDSPAGYADKPLVAALSNSITFCVIISPSHTDSTCIKSNKRTDYFVSMVASSFEYVWGDLYHAEDLALYQLDGFHPVYLGDLYDTRRYKVLHKLGHDSFSTTWLVRDQRLDSYVALKVIAVDASGNNCKDL